MKRLIYFLLIFSFSKLFGNPTFENKVRILYQISVTNKDSCKKLVTILQNYHEGNNCLLAGYKACATMIMAKHVFNPFSKYSYFVKGKVLLEKCITCNKQNVELRFLRFSIQTKAPTFLAYNKSINLDKLFIMNSLSQLKDIKLKQLIINFMKGTNYLTEIEKKKLNV